MKIAYTFQTVLDLGAMGRQRVEVDYSYDPNIHGLDLMTVYLLEGGRLGAEITDYLNDAGENQLYEEMSVDCAQQRAEQAQEAADAERDRMREEIEL